jgi:hypothetical protein
MFENTNIVYNRVEIALKMEVAHSEILVTSYFYQMCDVDG